MVVVFILSVCWVSLKVVWLRLVFLSVVVLVSCCFIRRFRRVCLSRCCLLLRLSWFVRDIWVDWGYLRMVGMLRVMFMVFKRILKLILWLGVFWRFIGWCLLCWCWLCWLMWFCVGFCWLWLVLLGLFWWLLCWLLIGCGWFCVGLFGMIFLFVLFVICESVVSGFWVRLLVFLICWWLCL